MQRNVWLAVAMAVASGCKEQAKEAPAAGSATAPAAIIEGQPVKRGTIRRPAFALLGVIAPPGADTTKLIDIAVKSGDVTAKPQTPAQLGWSTEQAQWYGHDYPQGDIPQIAQATYGIAISATESNAARRAGLAAIAVAKACHGWIVDLHAHQLYTADTYAPHVPGSGPADIRDLIVVHQVAGDGELAFLDTAGMTALGLPELYVADVPVSRVESVTSMVNATAQLLYEGGDVTRDGELDVDPRKLKGGEWHVDELEKAGGTARVTWQVTWSRADEDPSEKLDPWELQIQLSAKGAKRGSAEALLAAEKTFYGDVPDNVREFDYQDELDAAAVKARDALTKLRPHFAKGVPPGEQLAVKAPFPMDGGQGNEWMWLDVVSFKGNVLDGTLDNDPEHVSSLKIGSRVKVKLGDVADFIHTTADKKHAGGFSLEVMRAHGEDVPPL